MVAVLEMIGFLRDESGALSLSRLLIAGSFVVTSAIMAKLTVMGGMNEGYFSMYLGAYAGTYLVSKGLDKRGGKNDGAV